jgi:hypothetical protein
MHEITCSHCEFPFGVKQELLGKRLRCPSCKEVFTVPAPSSNHRERTQFEDSSARTSLDAPDRLSGKRKRKKRKSREDGVKSGSPSHAILWLAGGAILLFGMILGFAGGFFLFSRDEPFAELGGNGAEGLDASLADGDSDDPDSPQRMILGKWVGGISKDGMTYEFFKDGTVTLQAGKKTYPGNYKVIDATTLWMKGPTGENTMEMKLTPDELEFTARSKTAESKVGDGPTETKADDSISVTLRFKRPGAASETAAGGGPGSNPKESPGPASGSAKGSPAKAEQSKGSAGGKGRGKR